MTDKLREISSKMRLASLKRFREVMEKSEVDMFYPRAKDCVEPMGHKKEESLDRVCNNCDGDAFTIHCYHHKTVANCVSCGEETYICHNQP